MNMPTRRVLLVISLLGAASFIASGCGKLEIGMSGGSGTGGGPTAGAPTEAGSSGATAAGVGSSADAGAGAGADAGAGAGADAGAGAGGVSGGMPVAGANGEQGGEAGADHAAGGEHSGGAAGSGPVCAAPDEEDTWNGCYGAQACSVCASKIEGFPLYTLRHPHCTSFPLCDHSEQSPCSSDCPPPGDADQCDGTLGNWSGCRGLGCYVCTELVAGYPKYFAHHPGCLSNATCNKVYLTCSAACPAPDNTDL